MTILERTAIVKNRYSKKENIDSERLNLRSWDYDYEPSEKILTRA